MPAIEVCRDRESGSGTGMANEIEDFGVTIERLGCPVFGDFGKQAVLDGIPFGSAGGIVSHRHRETKAVAESGLKFGFPGAGGATVAAAGVGQDEQLAATRITISAVMLPPASDRVGGESSRVMRDAYKYRASIGEQVIDTIRDCDANGIGTEIVIIDAYRRTVPLDAIVPEVADQFSFLSVDADDRKPLTFKAGT